MVAVKRMFDVCLCYRVAQGSLRGKADNGCTNDMALANVDPCSNAGFVSMNIQRLCLREVDVQGYFRGQQRTSLKCLFCN